MNRIQAEVEKLSAEYSSIWRETKMLADISAAVLNMAREQEKERVQTRQKEI